MLKKYNEDSYKYGKNSRVTMNIFLERIHKYKAGGLRLLLCLIVVAGVYLLDYHCPFLTYLHLPCLGCGMSRAWKAAVQGNIREAFGLHQAFWTVPIICVYVFLGKPFKRKGWNILIISVISISFIINYIRYFI